MNPRLSGWLAILLLLIPGAAHAHLGSPDIFYDGLVGPYPARIVIRMPSVVPGRAEISVQVKDGQSAEVSFLPLYSRSSVNNAPPAEAGVPVPGENNLYNGDLWLMSVGAYSIEVRMHGKAGDGTVQIPVNSIALHQLPLPPLLEKILLTLGAALIFGGLSIISAAASESVLAPGLQLDAAGRRKSRVAFGVAAVIFTLALIGGWLWWGAEEQAFRRHLREGAWPDLETTVRAEGAQRILELTLGAKAFGPGHAAELIPDHGKLLHFFLIREDAYDVFAHLHPVRQGEKTFAVALPPVPEGRYRIFCDLTLEGSGLSSTAIASIQLPAPPKSPPSPDAMKPDPDDSWALTTNAATPPAAGGDAVFTVPDGPQVIWKSHPPLRAGRDAALEFTVRDPAGNPVALEPYMGMISHAAVMRTDGAVFAHLHPSGNYSMAAQSFFAAKLARETTGSGDEEMPAGMDHSQMHHGSATPGGSSISLPYEFPSAGDYRIWVQFKTGSRICTAAFAATVAAK